MKEVRKKNYATAHEGSILLQLRDLTVPPLPAKLTPLHFDHQGGLMEQRFLPDQLILIVTSRSLATKPEEVNWHP